MEETYEKRMLQKVADHMRDYHFITFRPLVLMVWAMVLAPDRPYHEVIQDWADYRRASGCDMDAGDWHEYMKSHLLRAGCDLRDGVGSWFRATANEVLHGVSWGSA